MKKPGIIFLTIVIFLLCCNKKKIITNSRIERFEKILGEPENSYLNEIVDDFDAFLDSKYKRDISVSKFKQYLLKNSEADISKFWRIDSLKLIKYRQSNLFAKYDFIYPDSIWYENGQINLKFHKYEMEESIIPNQRKKRVLNIDSIINIKKNEPRRMLIKASKFFVALDSVKQGSPLINYYLQTKNLSGSTPPHILTHGILYDLSNTDQYFCKRILIMELYDCQAIMRQKPGNKDL